MNEPVIDVIENPSPSDFESFLEAQRPVVVKGVVERWPAYERWTLEYMREHLAHRRLRVQESKTGELRLHVSHVRRITGATLFDAHASEDAAQRERYLATQVRVIDEAPSLLDDIAWPRFLPLGKVWQLCLWIAAQRTRTSLHWDGLPAMLAVVTGRKDFWLLPPEAYEHVYPNPLSDRPFVNWSSVDCFDPDLEAFPKYANVQPARVRLGPGDMIFVPPYWWHYVQNVETSMALRFEFDGVDSPLEFYNERRRIAASGRAPSPSATIAQAESM